MPNQEFEWVVHQPGSWQLKNNAGIKVWLSRMTLSATWSLDIGDMNRRELPRHLTTREAKRMTLGLVAAYVADFRNQLNASIEKLTPWE